MGLLPFLRDCQQARVSPMAAACLLCGVTLALQQSDLRPLHTIWVLIAVGGFGWLWLPWVRYVSLLALGFGLTQWHATQIMDHSLPASWDRRVLTVEGVVTDLPQQEPTGSRWQMRVTRAAVPEILGRDIRVNAYPAKHHGPGDIDVAERIHVGQHWSMQVQLKAPRSLINAGVFDAERAAFAKRISATATLKQPEAARLLATETGLGTWREAMSARIAATVKSPYARFVRALALGDTRWIGDADWTVLRNDGLTHLIAISGSHVGFVGALFALLARWILYLNPLLLRRIPRPVAMAIMAGIGGLLYAVVTGNEVPTLRTALMMGLLAGTLVLRRRVEPLDALCFVAIAMVLWDPLAVMGAGFWLSFLGVGWLMAVMPSRQEHAVNAFLRTQFVATFALMPVAVLLFGQISVAGSVANMLAVPWWGGVVVPLALVGTALETLHAGLGAWAWEGAARAFALTWPPFAQLADLSAAMAWIPMLAPAALLLACAAALWLTLPAAMPMRALGAAGLLPMLWPALPIPEPGIAQVTVLDVGQGLSVHVRTRGHELLYDAGPARPGGRDEGELTVLPYLRAAGVRQLDRLLVSHGDNDHAGGVAAVQDGLRVLRTDAPAGAGVHRAGICTRGQRWNWDRVEFEILWPLPGSAYVANDSSCVLRIRDRHGTVLLTGDIGVGPEREILALEHGRLHADVVTVPHHGSETSSSPEFIRALAARWAIAGTGFRNAFRHPRPAVVARWRAAGTAFVETASGGAARVAFANGRWQVSERRLEHRRLWDAEYQRRKSAHTVSYGNDRSGLQLSMDHIPAATGDR